MEISAFGNNTKYNRQINYIMLLIFIITILFIPFYLSIDLEETPNPDHASSDYSLEVGVNRLDEIRKLLKEDYKLNKHQQQEALG